MSSKRVKQAILVVALIAAAPLQAFEVPVADRDAWTVLAYRNIEPNRVAASDGSLHIAVDRSASPLVYRLDQPLTITAVTVDASWTGALEIPANTVQGEDGADDFVLKLGVVETGERTLNWLQRRIAAGWVQELFKLAPPGTGIRRVSFLSTTRQAALVGSERVHPLNDLLHETRIIHLPTPGAFTLDYRFPEPVEVIGLWISADGDDTESRFDVKIQRLTLHQEQGSSQIPESATR